MNLADLQAAAGLNTPIRNQLFINGRFVDAESGETLATLNPHDNSVITDVALAGKADTTIGRHLAAIGWKHRQAGDLPPTSRDARRVIADTLAGIRREGRIRPSARKARRIRLSAAPSSSPPNGPVMLRDRAGPYATVTRSPTSAKATRLARG